MPLPYYSRLASAEFWTEHWGAYSVNELLETASRSPLAHFLLDALPAAVKVLEAGCGPGHYVILLRRAGRMAFGVDFSWQALRQCRAADPEAPVSVMDLRALGFVSACFGCYVSLGVAEHDPDGPDAILAEAHRVLEPGGTLILSVPYVNGLRRIGGWWIRRRNKQVRNAGGGFYQFAFSRIEVRRFLERNGFNVLRASPYDPARILRRALRKIRCVAGRADASGFDGAHGGDRDLSSELKLRGAPARRALRRLLYTRLWLRAFGHMILFVAAKR